MLSLNGWGQIGPRLTHNEKQETRIIAQVEIYNTLAEYINWCYADSIVVGYEYTLSESHNMSTSQEFYSSCYYDLLDKDQYGRTGCWDLNGEKYGLTANEFWNEVHRERGQTPGSYVRAEPIRIPDKQPTLEGYVEWLGNSIKENL